ncbi:MAG: 4-(cytidine 5'-diphospho)-2-C-methyl-D-erythritol kinase, partial [Muribaculaceae bacterium]|nr:4-(cytidine 5'-diphospho)-2-C-methyl-D-erythritol kinase [Muribaculaceae bacterium]
PTILHLHKIIPDGAGLGGGSADAAFALRGLNSLYNLGLPDGELCRLAAMIGADCPFFIYDRPMLCTGTGTDMSPIDVPQILGKVLAIVKPPVSVNTAAAYSRVTPHEPAEPLAQRISRPLGQWQDSVINDFEASVFPQFPQLAVIKEALIAEGAAYSAMSGSGSSLFGIFDCQSADNLAERLKARFEGCDVHVAEL